MAGEGPDQKNHLPVGSLEIADEIAGGRQDDDLPWLPETTGVTR